MCLVTLPKVFLSIYFVILLGSIINGEDKKPNIIIIVADDMGFDDVGFHGNNQIPTPNIDALAYNGVILNSHYTQALCTPSRSALMTGKYPINLGMQHLVILEPEPWGLPLNETLLPEYLKKNGYKTHAIGKWHLGFFKREYTPTYRGFDTHYGYWQGLQDYYEHTVHATYTPEEGYDMRRNMEVDWSVKGKYSTTVFTEEAVRLIDKHDTTNPMFMYFAHLAPHTGNDEDPLQAPDDEIAKFSEILDPERRIYAAMVSMLDASIGKVVSALRKKRMLDNSIIIFISDNGAQTEGVHANHGSNYPLRGLKNSPWEGAMRGVATVWSPLIKHPNRVSNELMHISDWLPTIFSAAKLNRSELPEIDGVDVWDSISEGSRSSRVELVHNIDDIYNYGALRKGDWKYLYGSTSKGKKDLWYGIPRTKERNYDANSVVTSPVASALAGVITYKQIQQKHTYGKTGENETYAKLLTPEMITYIRSSAQVKCKISHEVKEETHICDPFIAPCLFNIRDDPCEMFNLASERPVIATNMEHTIERLRKSAKPPRNVPRDPNADPKFWNNTWTTWQDQDVFKQRIKYNNLSPLAISLISASCVAFLIVVILLAILASGSSKKHSRNSSNENVLAEQLEKFTQDGKSGVFDNEELRN